jgi:hypothetical protein
MDATQPGADFLAALRQRGWTIQSAASRDPLLPADLRQRYPRLPAEVTDFLESIESCVARDETVWFLCRADYRRTDGEGFRWNEFELITLEDQTAEAQAQIRAFWDFHFPFMLAVHSDYDYLAVSLDDRSYGRIVHGCGPAFEDTSTVAPTFAQFLALFRDMAAGHGDEGYPLSCFL